MTGTQTIRVRSRSVRTLALAMILALVATACGSSSDDVGSSPAETTAAPGEPDAVTPTSTIAGSAVPTETAPPVESVPLLEPAVEFEVADLGEAKSIALSPDASLVAVHGGGQGRDVEPFLRVYDTATGDQTGEVTTFEDKVNRIFWTADNRIVGTDVLSSEAQILTWDGGTLELVDSFTVAKFACISGVTAFDPAAGALFSFDGSEVICHRDLSSDALIEVTPFADGQSINALKLRGDSSELVALVYDRNTERDMIFRLDPTTLEVLGETVFPERIQLEGVGIDVDMYSADTGSTQALTLEPTGLALPPRLDRPHFSPDGLLLWAVSEREDVELMIDAATGDVIGQFAIGRGFLVGGWSLDGSALAHPTAGTSLQIFRP